VSLEGHPEQRRLKVLFTMATRPYLAGTKYAVAGILGFLVAGSSGIVVTGTNVANTLANALISDYTDVTLLGASYVGKAASAGTFTSGPFGIHDGIIITSGSASTAQTDLTGGKGTNNGLTGSTLCSAVTGVTSYDASVLSLNVTSASASNITISFVFASHEYPK
jgi:hypothetical protein